MRRLDPFDKRAMVFSATLHVGLFLVGWASTRYQGPEIDFIAYEIELVSPPPAARADESEVAREELVVERPETEPQPEPDVPDVVPIEDPEPEVEPEPTPEPQPEPTPEPEPVEEEEERPSAAPDAPDEEDPTESGEGINVRMEGLRRDYPEYYNNIIRQIQRCFRWRGGGNWETKVSFVIQRDGSVSDLEFVTRSGSSGFDFEAMGAVDCAGQGRFGSLPEDLPWESLPILFDFRPIGGGQ